MHATGMCCLLVQWSRRCRAAATAAPFVGSRKVDAEGSRHRTSVHVDARPTGSTAVRGVVRRTLHYHRYRDMHPLVRAGRLMAVASWAAGNARGHQEEVVSLAQDGAGAEWARCPQVDGCMRREARARGAMLLTAAASGASSCSPGYNCSAGKRLQAQMRLPALGAALSRRERKPLAQCPAHRALSAAIREASLCVAAVAELERVRRKRRTGACAVAHVGIAARCAAAAGQRASLHREAAGPSHCARAGPRGASHPSQHGGRRASDGGRARRGVGCERRHYAHHKCSVGLGPRRQRQQQQSQGSRH
eukprot:scaffold146_cov374-Prasinococcus_capsulatus_cf.AAC.11